MSNHIKLVHCHKDGSLTQSMKNYFGGEFSSVRQLKMKGIGSSKIIYIKGLDILDEGLREISGELAFVNFELLKNGLLFRSNINQRRICLGILLDKIKSIKILSIPIPGFHSSNKDLKISKSYIDIIDVDHHVFTFEIPPREYFSIISFFNKKKLVEKVNHAILRAY